MARPRQPPFELEVAELGPRGVGVGVGPDGRAVHVGRAPPGGRVAVVPTGRRSGIRSARRAHLVRPPAAWEQPRCAVFGLCGGCALQELSLEAQRALRHDWALRAIAPGLGLSVEALRGEVHVAPIRGLQVGYGYRNKIELSFGTARYLSDADHAAGLAHRGAFLGFHAAGRFDRVVDAERCELVSEPMNALLAVVREHALGPGAPAPRDVRTHLGFWRHLVLREGQRTGQRLVAVITSPPADPAEDRAVTRLAEALIASGHGVVGVVWLVDAGVADVARGDLARAWGSDRFEERLGRARFTLSHRSFFQTSADGAELLYDTVAEALEVRGGTLLDLYCGTGALGLYLADRFDRVVGLEEVPEAVEDARANAARSGVAATYHVGRVEDALGVLEGLAGAGEPAEAAVVVDPPRAGLHPRVAAALCRMPARSLAYVACNPASLGRDAALLAEAWRMTDLATVDLFPQTGHVEAVARFVRR